MLYIPKGFAHGFCVLSEKASVLYKVSQEFSSEHERGIAFDDKDLKINWQLKPQILKLSNKDLNHPTLANIQDLLN